MFIEIFVETFVKRNENFDIHRMLKFGKLLLQRTSKIQLGDSVLFVLIIENTFSLALLKAQIWMISFSNMHTDIQYSLTTHICKEI